MFYKQNKKGMKFIMDKDSANSLAQDKVLILYVLSNLKYDITESNLFKLVSPVNNMNYFYFKQVLTDLVDSKLVGSYNNEESDEENENNLTVYKITSDGKTSLDLTIDVLPGLLKLKADTVFKNELNKL